MTTHNSFNRPLSLLFIATLATSFFTGCQGTPTTAASQQTTAATAPVANPAPEAAAAPQAAPANQLSLPIRIKAGATDGFTDNSGNVWLGDRGFADGETTDRSELTITNATDQQIYRSERYSMTRFTQPLPNGKYIVKLHFCETYDGISGPGQRVFSFNVAGHEFKDFDVWVKAGGPLRAYVETVPVEITNGNLEITFAPNVENPQINGLEILPAP